MAASSTGFTGPQYYNDCIGPIWFEPFADDLVRRLPQRPSGEVLEIACGTGIVTSRLRDRLEPEVRLVATDLSKPMLEYATARLADREGIEWSQADAMKLPFESGRFGAVVCGFGLMFVPDWQGALSEARRVLVDGGILVFNVWDRIEENMHVLVNAQVVEAMFPGDDEMRFRRPYEMHDPGLLRGLLESARFRETRIETRRIPIEGADPRRIATGHIRGTPRSGLIAQRGVSLDLVIDRVTAALTRAGGDPYSGHAQAVIVEAQAI